MKEQEVAKDNNYIILVLENLTIQGIQRQTIY